MSFWTEPRGLRSWLLTTDHKRIGLMFFVGVVVSLLVGGIFALIMRVELATPDGDVVSAHTYSELFTHHGIVMVFLFMIPSIPGAFGNFLVPIMIGARDVAFPKLNLLSFYVYMLGAAIVLYGLFAGGVDTGWTFYAPYSTTSPTSVTVVAVGIFVLGVSSILSGLNFIVTVHTLRAKGIGWMRLPLFVWTIYATAVIQVLATPVLGMSLLVVGFDRIWHIGLFEPAMGGDPVLFQHLFWFYSHPAVYIMILPAMGVVSEVVAASAHNRPAWYHGLVAATIGIAFVGFLTWGHHMFVAGISTFDAGIFGILSMLVGIFSAIKVFAWTSTFYGGSITIATPVLYVFTFIFLFVFGGMSGVAFATSSLDVPWHDTYFVVAHFHFIMVGGTTTAFLAAIHFWFPKITGRMYPEAIAKVACGAVSLGFVLTFTPQFLLGNAGMPRRYYTYPPQYQWLHVISTTGAFLLALGMAITLGYLIVACFIGKKTPGNPWHSRGFEWRCDSPPPPENFHGVPEWPVGHYSYDEDTES